jgi:recombination protein RecR
MKEADALAIADAITEAKRDIKFCSVCGNFTTTDPCPICERGRGKATQVIVVESPKDVTAIERIRDYDGYYHVLHGAIAPTAGITPEMLNIRTLIVRLQNEPNIKEVILATNPTIEGEATAMYIAKLIKDSGLEVTRIAHGVSIGSELEYTDEATLKKALDGRRKI